MSPDSSRPSFRVVAATVAMAAFVGGLSGVVAALLAPTKPAATTAVSGTVGAEPPDQVGEVARIDPLDAVGDPDGNDNGSRPTRSRRRGGNAERQDAATRLSSPDPDVRYAEAKKIVLRGPSALRLLSRLRPPTDRGRQLVEDMQAALVTLRYQQRGTRYAGLMEDKKLELQLAALRKVVPDRYLAAERSRYWSAKTVSDAIRLEKGTIREGELLMAQAQRARAERELGKLGEDDYRQCVAERLEPIRAWVATARKEQRFLGAPGKELDRQLAALEE